MKYQKITVLWQRMADAGITTYWYAPKLITRLVKQNKAVLPKDDKGWIRMTDKMINDFISAFTPGGKMKYP